MADNLPTLKTHTFGKCVKPTLDKGGELIGCKIRLELRNASCCEMGGIFVSMSYGHIIFKVARVSDNIETKTAKERRPGHNPWPPNLYTMVLSNQQPDKCNHSPGIDQINHHIFLPSCPRSFPAWTVHPWRWP